MNEFNRENVGKYYIHGGPIAKIIPGYRYREEQVCLSEKIAEVFMNQEFLIAEAGTGIGKTFAYLIPAVLWSVQEQEKVVVSTKTKALQQQLIERDIPALQKVVDFDFNYAEAKGRENYLCWNKYEKIRTGKKRLEASEMEFIESILQWAEQTGTGDKKELGIESELMKNWGLVASDRKTCLKGHCRYREKCFHLKMIKKLEKADIIIVNHALLLSDMLVNNSILPEYRYLIIDEAHTFVREAFDGFSRCFLYQETIDMLNIMHYQGNKHEKGYIKYLANKYPQMKLLLSEISSLAKFGIRFTGDLFSVLSKKMKGERNYSYSYVLQGQDMEDLINEYQRGKDKINLLIDKLKLFKDELVAKEEESELNSIIESLQECFDNAFTIIEEDSNQDEKIVWVNFKRGKAISISSSSIYIGKKLNSYLYEKLDSVVLVSATLTIEDKFDFFCDLSGLSAVIPEDRVNKLLQKSPFDYDTQACIYIAKDMPEPDSPAYNNELYRVLGDIFVITGGRILVLFTSRKQLKEAAGILRSFCENAGLKLLAQYDDGEFGFLLDEFTGCDNAVLMGVETFWEGVDLKGELLKCLVMVRLPFRAPSDPFSSAGNKHFTMQNKNAFKNFILPDTIVRFKQGIGRLIRSENDRGVVIILDTRLGKRSYSKLFMNSVPIKNVINSSISEMGEHIKIWL